MSAEHDDHADADDLGNDTVPTEEPAPDAPPAPRRAYRRAAPVVEPSRELSIFGSLPERATHFGIRKKSPRDRFESCFGPSPDGEAEVREWPLSLLSLSFVRDHWGAGTYRVEWVGTTTTGGRGFICNGREFVVREREQPQTIAAPPAPRAADPLDMAVRFMEMTDQRVNSQLSAIAQLAGAIAGNRPQGPDTSALELMLERQRIATQEAVQSAVAPLQQELATVRARFAEFEAEDETPPARASSSNPGPAQLFKPGVPMGETVKAALFNWAASNPGEAMSIAKEVIALGKKIVGTVEAPPAPPPRARAVDVQVVRQPSPQPSPPVPPPAPLPTEGEPSVANGAAAPSPNDVYRNAASNPPPPVAS